MTRDEMARMYLLGLVDSGIADDADDCAEALEIVMGKFDPYHETKEGMMTDPFFTQWCMSEGVNLTYHLANSDFGTIAALYRKHLCDYWMDEALELLENRREFVSKWRELEDENLALLEG